MYGEQLKRSTMPQSNMEAQEGNSKPYCPSRKKHEGRWCRICSRLTGTYMLEITEIGALVPEITGPQKMLTSQLPWHYITPERVNITS